MKALARERNKSDRAQAIRLLGGQCVCCGETRFQFLEIDHVFNDGAVERKSFNNTQLARRFLAGRADVTRYQLLCGNCHNAKSYHGVCPHVAEQQAELATAVFEPA